MTPPFLHRPPPGLPPPLSDSSHLTRRYGAETINYGAGSGLNRASFLRTNIPFLRAASTHSEAQYIVLSELEPLMALADASGMAVLGYEDIYGPLQQKEGGKETGVEYPPPPFTKTEAEALAHPEPLIIFLGIEEGVGEHHHTKIHGRPWFAVDVSPSTSPSPASLADHLLAGKDMVYWHNRRDFTLRPQHAAIYAQARTIMDWNRRNRFCAACSRPTIPWDGGYRRACIASTPPCPIGTSISNISFPRTDPVMIAVVVSADGQRVLLGHHKRSASSTATTPRYSTLAGFIEPGESAEDAVRREVWEEAGVRVGRVVLHSTQPWPYPNNLMIGAIAQAKDADGAESVDVGLDEELVSARWFGVGEIRDILEAQKRGEAGKVSVAPLQAIENRLLTAVVEGFLGN